MEEPPKRNSDLESLDIFSFANHYFLLFFGMTCLLSSILIQEVFLVIDHYLLGISISSVAGIILPVYFITRRFPAGFRKQIRLHAADVPTLLRVVAASLLIVVVIDYIYLFSQHFIPAPQDYMENLLKLKPKGPGNFLITFVGLCLAVPLAEEMLFRGVFQQVFSLNMSPRLAVVLSGMFFGVVHLNAHLLISITVFGILLGFIFYATANLTYVIIMHAIFNTVSFFQLAFTQEEKLTEPPFYTQHLWMLTAAVVVLAWLLMGIKKGAAAVEEAPWDRD